MIYLESMNQLAPSDDIPNLLVVDDDDRLRDLLRRYLSDNGFLVATAANAQNARKKLNALDFDLIVLDLMMPGESGLDFAADLRATRGVPVLMLTAMSEPGDRITGLEHGADDYLVKPFEPRELLLRINNVLKRVPKAAPPPAEIRLGDMTFNSVRGDLTDNGGGRVPLTAQEATLMGLLAAKPGQIFTRDELIKRSGGAAGGRAIDVQVTRLRRKFEPDPRRPRYLQTARGKGYILKPD